MPWHDASVAYDEGLATRLRNLLANRPRTTTKRMFGGLGIMLHGNMAVGVYGDDLLIRVDPEERAELLARPGVHEFLMGGRAPLGFLLVSARECADDADLARWVAVGVAQAERLPPK